MNPRAVLPALLLLSVLSPACAAEAPKTNATTSTAVAAPTAPAAVARIDPAAAAKLVAEGKAVLVDCRESSEWADTGVAGPATLLAKSDFDGAQLSWKPFLAANKDKEIIIYCRSGNRSGIVAAALAAQGYKVANGGAFTAWQAAGLPVRPSEPAAPAKTAP